LLNQLPEKQKEPRRISAQQTDGLAPKRRARHDQNEKASDALRRAGHWKNCFSKNYTTLKKVALC
jgi:hypothetical protein